MITDIKDIIDKNNVISAMGAIDYSNFLESKLPQIQNDKPVKLQEIPGKLLKITIPECLPRMSIYCKVVFIDNKPLYAAYSAARRRWYGLIRKALENFSGKKIDPCLIYVVYYTPVICDFDNYSIKFIMDAIKYHGCIKNDDNFLHIQEGTRQLRLDKENPRTEIYIIEDDNSIDKLLNICDKKLQDMENKGALNANIYQE